ncbi:MAG TPA: metallophosphoesterase [Planctomycetes bacterium]|nr:metallophosphoesterase [Planctomycetota bacterium]
MRYGILGDIHGNMEALDAVLQHLEAEKVDHYVSVGDIVGYGADPGPCLDRIREIGATVVAGNHDWAVVGRLDCTFFNAYAKAAVEWTAQTLTAEQMAWLENLPLTARLGDDLEVAHATRENPERFDYIQTYYDAARSINAMVTPVCFLGHSHVPLAFLMREQMELSVDPLLDLQGVGRALINVGSIGQPRDENPKAACAVFDAKTRRYELRRVSYDVDRTCQKILAVGLPQILADRLRFGR